MIIESKEFSPGQAGEIVAAFSVKKRATGVWMDRPTGAIFTVERIDRLTVAELGSINHGVHLVGVNGESRHGLRIAVRCTLAAGAPAAKFRAEVDLEIDTGAMERELGFVVERGIRQAHHELEAQRRKG